jgi:E3 ubiquitin-protein ligase UBR7
LKGGVTREEPAQGNKYNQNFRNKFCGCGEEYDPYQEKGTMFQCLGLGSAEEGGCGEDWWHPECIVGLTREEYLKSVEKPKEGEVNGSLEKGAGGDTKKGGEQATEENDNKPIEQSETSGQPITVRAGVDGNDMAAQADEEEDDVEDDTPLPPGFPQEDDFEHFICYKCVDTHHWIKRYAGTEGFLPPIYIDAAEQATKTLHSSTLIPRSFDPETRKRKADDVDLEIDAMAPTVAPLKRQKSEDPATTLSTIPEATTPTLTPKKQDTSACKVDTFPPAPSSDKPLSLFVRLDFREHFCRCAGCFPLLKRHPQLLEEEETYEPPVSEDGNDNPASVGTGSIYDRGEAAFSNMDRVRAIQGAMAYAHLKDSLKSFLQPFAENKQAVGAEDIKAYFEKLRGDEQGIKDAAGGAAKRTDKDQSGDDGDNRREQSGY